MARLHDIQYNTKILSPCSFFCWFHHLISPFRFQSWCWPLQTPAYTIEYETRSYRPDLHVRYQNLFSIIDTINFSGSTALTPEAQTLKRTFGQVSSRAPTGLVCRRGSSSPRRPFWSSHHWPPGSLHGLSPWRSPCWSTPWPPEWPTSRVTFQEKKSSKFGIPLLKTHSAAGDIPGKHFFCSCVSLSTWLLYESDNEWSKCTREANGHNDEIKDIQCGCVCF